MNQVDEYRRLSMPGSRGPRGRGLVEAWLTFVSWPHPPNRPPLPFGSDLRRGSLRPPLDFPSADRRPKPSFIIDSGMPSAAMRPALRQLACWGDFSRQFRQLRQLGQLFADEHLASQSFRRATSRRVVPTSADVRILTMLRSKFPRVIANLNHIPVDKPAGPVAGTTR